MTDRITGAAVALTRAFAGPRLSRLDPEVEPRDEAEAYAVQSSVLGTDPVAGWKVAPARNGVTRCAPLGHSRLLADGGCLPPGMHAPLLEVELALRLARDVPAGTPSDQVLAALGEVCLAFEILDSRFTDRKAVSPHCSLADAQSNRAFAAAGTGAPWASVEFGQVPLALYCDGVLLEQTPGGASSAEVAAAVIWLADHAAGRGLPLQRGQIIITGSRLGPIPLPKGCEIRATGGGVGEATLFLNNQTPVRKD